MNGFVKCSNGHYYNENLTACPYCKNNNNATTDFKGNDEKTVINNSNNNGNKTEIYGADNNKFAKNNINPAASSNRTVFSDEVKNELENGKVVVEKKERLNRKLVGWLVSYSIDPLGVDFRLFEGRNTIGRGMSNTITVQDNMLSEHHATVLFRENTYILKDELSSHGTFVNDIDIIDENYRLKDGDIIKMGSTTFKFKSSL